MPFDEATPERPERDDDPHRDIINLSQAALEVAELTIIYNGGCLACCTQLIAQMIILRHAAAFETTAQAKEWLADEFVGIMLDVIEENRS